MKLLKIPRFTWLRRGHLLVVPALRLAAVLMLTLLAIRGATQAAEVKLEDTPSSTPEAMAPVAQTAAALPHGTAVVGEIVIVNENVFDLTEPKENKLMYRKANALHMRTRPGVIRQQLLFRSGEPFSLTALEESERILRAARYIQDATIEPIRHENGQVDVRVTTKDSWTLRPTASFGRSGSENNGKFGFDEMNLFGTGIRIGARYTTDVDRDSRRIHFVDQNLGDSWYQLQASYSSNSDGHTITAGIDRPFFSLDARSAGGVSIIENDRIDSLYDRGSIVSQYRARTNRYEAYKGWSKGASEGLTRRYTAGLAYESHDFESAAANVTSDSTIPGNRTLAYPFFGFEMIEDGFEEVRNLEQINRTEDRNLGTHVSARIGFASTQFDSDRDAVVFDASIQRGYRYRDAQSLLFSSAVSARREGAGWRNSVLRSSVKYFHRQSEKRLFYAGLQWNLGRDLNIDNLTFLGGDSGLRGYPLRYQMGESSALLTIEQRFFTDWYPFQLFHVGGAVFMDVGRVWGKNPVGEENLGVLKDIGIGLRLGNSRTARGHVLHIDFAFPLDGDDSIDKVQFLVGTKKSF